MHPQAPYGPNFESKGEDSGKRRSWGTFPDSQHFEGRGACWSSGMATRKIDKQSITHKDLHKLNNKLVNV
jgi:hypothetical protein